MYDPELPPGCQDADILMWEMSQAEPPCPTCGEHDTFVSRFTNPAQQRVMDAIVKASHADKGHACAVCGTVVDAYRVRRILGNVYTSLADEALCHAENGGREL